MLLCAVAIAACAALPELPSVVLPDDFRANQVTLRELQLITSAYAQQIALEMRYNSSYAPQLYAQQERLTSIMEGFGDQDLFITNNVHTQSAASSLATIWYPFAANQSQQVANGEAGAAEHMVELMGAVQETVRQAQVNTTGFNEGVAALETLSPEVAGSWGTALTRYDGDEADAVQLGGIAANATLMQMQATFDNISAIYTGVIRSRELGASYNLVGVDNAAGEAFNNASAVRAEAVAELAPGLGMVQQVLTRTVLMHAFMEQAAAKFQQQNDAWRSLEESFASIAEDLNSTSGSEQAELGRRLNDTFTKAIASFSDVAAVAEATKRAIIGPGAVPTFPEDGVPSVYPSVPTIIPLPPQTPAPSSSSSLSTAAKALLIVGGVVVAAFLAALVTIMMRRRSQSTHKPLNDGTYSP